MRTRAWFWVGLVAAVHVMVLGVFVLLQGCETPRRAAGPPPPPVMPPREAPVAGPPAPGYPPAFQPPVAVEPAPEKVALEPGQTYTVQKGDTLSGIAKRYGVSWKDLAEINAIKDPNKIRAGQKLILPLHAKPAPAAPAKTPGASAALAAGGVTHVVVRGDTLSGIAAKYGVTIRALREANQLSGDKILVGQKLVVPQAKSGKTAEPKAAAPAPEKPAAPAPAPPMPTPVTAPEEPQVAPERSFEYTVLPGDTLDSIARDYVVLKEDIIRANKLSPTEPLKPGQKLIIPQP